MTTYIATIKRLADSEINDQTHDTDIRMLALHLFTVLKERGWTGGPNPTMAKLRTGQAVIHDGFEYVITRKVEINLRPHVRDRARVEELFRSLSLPVEVYEITSGGIGSILKIGGSGFEIFFSFRPDGDFNSYSVGPGPYG